MATHTWLVSFIRYSVRIVKWTKTELDEIDRKTRKVMKMNRELHTRSDRLTYFIYLGWIEKED